MSKNLLYFNLAIDEKDTSLGFTIDWLNTIAEEFDQVDVISLRVNGIPKVNDSIKIYGLENGKNRISKYIYFLKKLRELTKENNYERCFSHMSPISVVLGKFFLVRHKIKTTLWFTHPGPKIGLKKLILYLAFLFSENVVTASENSFPFSGRKVATIGHSINLDLFNNNKKIYSVNKILVLSRISKSKNIEMSIEGFLNSDLKNSSIDIIGGPLNKKDKEYFERLKIQYKDKRVNFLGRVTHKDLPEILSKYDVHINSAGNGFFDKSVLETLSCGLINIYRNSDFNYIFGDSKFNFKNEEQLVEKINEVSKLNTEELEQVFKTIDRSLKDNSLSTLNQRLRNYL